MSDNIVLDSRRKALEEEYFNRKNAEALEKLAGSIGVESKRCPVSTEPMKVEAFNGVIIYRSPVTQGVWIEGDDLKVLLDASQKDKEMKWDLAFFKSLAEEARIHAKRGALKVAEIEESQRLSPVNGKPMEKLDISGVIVDRCPESGGMWFDLGEFNEFLEKAGKPEEAHLSTWLAHFFKSIMHS